MIEKMNLKESFFCQRTRKPRLNDSLNLQGMFYFEQYRNGLLIAKADIKNAITNVGKNLLLNCMFNGATQIANANWKMGLIDAASWTTGTSVTDTMSSHTGWVEFVGYSEAARPAWGSGTTSSQVTGNAVPVVFTITSAGVLKGAFIISDGTKGGAIGTLWNTALFPADYLVAIDDELKFTYSTGV